MFTKSAQYYDALYNRQDYAEASSKLLKRIREIHPGAKSLLDIGCGTGRHLEHLMAHFEVAGLDLNPDLLALARTRCPGVPFYEADMSDFGLDHRFDVVTCLFSSIAYVRTLERMRQAIACMKRHLAPGGLLIVEPWFTPEQYWTETITANFVDRPELKIAWMYISERVDCLSVLDINYLVGTPQSVSYFTERHEMGLFTSHEYLGAFEEVGLSAEHDPEGLFKRGLYIGTDPVERS